MDGLTKSKMPFLDGSTESLKWLELAITAAPALEDALYGLLTERRLGGWVVEAEESQLVLVCYLPCESGWEIRLSSLKDALRQLGASAEVRKSVVDEDWANCWKQFYHVRHWGKTLVIRPSWEEYEPQSGQHVITLDPGMAFGTGLHGSTSNCLLLLEDYLLNHAVSNALDVGTGSGILAIEAALLGVECVVACDNDPVAVRTARENVALNGQEARVSVQEFEGVPEGTYDLVIANIVAAVHISLAEDYARAVKPGGALLVSGIIDFRRDEVLETLQECGFALEQERLEDEWVSLRLVRQ